MHNELLDFVNSSDIVIGKCKKHEIYDKKLRNRICHVMVVSSDGKIALQKRSKNVSYLPGALGTSAGGHVSSGDSYLSSANRELKEEIGIAGDLKLIGKDFYVDPTNNHEKFLGIFELTYDGDFDYIDGEVEIVEYFSLSEIKEMVKNKEFLHPELIFILKKYYF